MADRRAHAPHALERLNQHSRTIACQACHIPAYGTGGPVLIAWNWLMTGKTNSVLRAGTGAGQQLHDQNGFWSARDIEPVYLWDDGADQVYTRGQKIQPLELTVLQQPTEKSANSKLAPFRVLYGTQLYDSRYRYLISPLLHPEGNMLFPGCDWESIARKGMEAMVLPFSGQYGFTATATYPGSTMVLPLLPRPWTVWTVTGHRAGSDGICSALPVTPCWKPRRRR